MTSRARSRDPHRFRIVVEGYTRFVSANEQSADATLIMPRPFRNAKGDVTNEVMLGSVPLADVEWLAEPLKVGDVVTDAAQLDALPDGSIVASANQSAVPAAKRRGRWYIGTSHSLDAVWIAEWSEAAVVLRIGASL